MATYTQYVPMPIPIPMSNSFEEKSNMNTEEAILLKDWMIYNAVKDSRFFQTKSEVVMAPKRELERMEKEKWDNIDPVKVVMFTIILMLLAKWAYDYDNRRGY